MCVCAHVRVHACVLVCVCTAFAIVHIKCLILPKIVMKMYSESVHAVAISYMQLHYLISMVTYGLCGS